MDKEQQFHFRIRVGEIEVEASGPQEYVSEMKNYAEQLVSSSLTRMKTIGAVSPEKEVTATVEVEPTKPPLQPWAKDESIAEFLERVPSKTHQDKILGFAYFLEKSRGAESFGVKEINDCYDEVREAKSNTAQYFTYLVKGGLIMKAKNQPPGASTQYVLTRKGETTIKNILGITDDAQ